LRIVTLGFGTARQRMILERWTNPNPNVVRVAPGTVAPRTGVRWYPVPGTIVSRAIGGRRVTASCATPPPEIPHVTALIAVGGGGGGGVGLSVALLDAMHALLCAADEFAAAGCGSAAARCAARAALVALQLRQPACAWLALLETPARLPAAVAACPDFRDALVVRALCRTSCIMWRTLHHASCIMWRTLHHASCGVHCIMHHVGYTASCIMWRTLHHASCGVHCIMHHVAYTASCIMWDTLHHASCGVHCIMHVCACV
jgi:hypothetical protein